MKNNPVLWVLAAAGLALCSCGKREEPAAGTSATATATAAAATKLDFRIPALGASGGEIALKDFEGKVVLLDFWATWCPPCRSELPSLNNLYRELKDRNFVLLGMTVDQGDLPAVAQAVGRFTLDYPVGLANAEVQALFGGIRAVPTKILLDRSGKIVQRYLGVVAEEQLRKDIDALLQGG